MAELFAQVWFLCVIAFLAGAAVTWLLFVRAPRRRPAPPRPVARARHAPPEPPRSLPRRPQLTRAELPPPAEPALANLDTHSHAHPARHAGSSAAGALDRLGVASGSRAPDGTAPAAEIPTKAHPIDEPAAGDGRA